MIFSTIDHRSNKLQRNQHLQVRDRWTTRSCVCFFPNTFDGSVSVERGHPIDSSLSRSFQVPRGNWRPFDERQKDVAQDAVDSPRTQPCYLHVTRCPLRNDGSYAIEFTPRHATRAPVCTHARARVCLRSNGNGSRQRSRSCALFLPRVTKAGACHDLVGGEIARDLYE